MKFCIRREIDFTNSEERLRKVERVPIEIALPPDLAVFLENRHRLMEVKKQLKQFNIPVRSVHAPHGHLADATFRDWARAVIGFAEAVDAEIVVFHPETKTGENGGEQSAAILNVKYVQDRTKVTVALETFWGKDRLLTPDDIMENHLPMVLDTSLIPKPEILWIMEIYHKSVKNIHLSAVIPRRRTARGNAPILPRGQRPLLPRYPRPAPGTGLARRGHPGIHALAVREIHG